MTTQVRPNIAIPSGLDVAAGLWLVASPFVLKFSTVANATISNVVAGAAVAILAGISASGTYKREWLSWLAAVLGLWVVVSPWIFNFSKLTVPMWSNAITGVVIAMFALWSGSLITGKMPFSDSAS